MTPVAGRPLTAEADPIEPCGGCGETNPSRRCLGCLHDFVSRPASDQPVEAIGAGWEDVRLAAAKVIDRMAFSDSHEPAGKDRREVWLANKKTRIEAAIAKADEVIALVVGSMTADEKTAALAHTIRTELLGVRPDDQGVTLEDDDWRLIIAALSPASPARTPHVDATGHEYSPDGSGHCRHCGAEGPRLTARREAAKAERERSIEREAAAEARDLPPAHVEGDRGDPGVNGGETTRLNGAGQDGREGNPPQRANPMMTHVLSVVPCEPTEEMLKALEDADIFQSRETTSMIWRAMIAALSPAAPARPELTVWYGKMPESNGRENWTALLRRVNPTDKWDQGFCFARSEYPGRVLYEADRVRWIIGERAERPDILAYDADAHSGYVEPASPARTPMGGRVDGHGGVTWPAASADLASEEGLESIDALVDMARVGVNLMERLPEGYDYSDCPTEIVTDLQNQLDEAKTPMGGEVER